MASEFTDELRILTSGFGLPTSLGIHELLIEFHIDTGNGSCNRPQVNQGAIGAGAAGYRCNRQDRYMHDGEKDGRNVEFPVSEMELFGFVILTAGIGFVFALYRHGLSLPPVAEP